MGLDVAICILMYAHGVHQQIYGLAASLTYFNTTPMGLKHVGGDYHSLYISLYFCILLNPPMAKEGGGGGGVVATPQQVFPVFLGNEKSFFQTKSLAVGSSFHETNFQIGPTVLDLKLDKARVLGGGGCHQILAETMER